MWQILDIVSYDAVWLILPLPLSCAYKSIDMIFLFLLIKFPHYNIALKKKPIGTSVSFFCFLCVCLVFCLKITDFWLTSPYYLNIFG